MLKHGDMFLFNISCNNNYLVYFVIYL